MSGVFYPSAPLLDRARAGRPWHQARRCPYCLGNDREVATCVTAAELGAELDVAGETIQRWKSGRRIDGTLVDRLATVLGTHPGELWPSWWSNCPTRERSAA